MVRAPFIDKNGLKKDAWSEEEDNKLRAYVQRYGHWNWRQLPRFAGLARCGKSCRLRWMNYLKPGVRRGSYTPEEEEIIQQLHEEFGTRWSFIASKLPGRTDNEIKNHWHSHLRKRPKQERKSTSASEETLVHFNANNHYYEHHSSNSWGTSDSIHKNDEIIETNNVVDENVYSEVSSFYYDPAATHFDDIGTLDWAVLAGILSPVENIMTPSDQEFWSHPFSLDASHTSLHHQLQLPPLMEQEGDEVMCPNVEEDDIINWLHDLLQ